MKRPLSPEDDQASLNNVSRDDSHVEAMLARFGPEPHRFTDEDRRKAVEVRRQKAAERRERAMTFPEFAREQIENDPARWFEPYEKARGEGEWRAPEALMDRVYGLAEAGGGREHGLRHGFPQSRASGPSSGGY